jgi:hypothetical protein
VRNSELVFSNQIGMVKEKQDKKKCRKGYSGGDGTPFSKQLYEQYGLEVVVMASDGNCLFRSLSDQLHQDYGENHEEVRREIMDYIERNSDHFKLFIVLADDENDRRKGRKHNKHEKGKKGGGKKDYYAEDAEPDGESMEAYIRRLR